ncbi:MAG TPA: transcription antitermination factor NusB [Acidimicrobiales bacterium]|nr:transcription antitermination factor NusB [Acidimicrobiales bacterium]
MTVTATSSAREIAVEALLRIDDGAYANLILPTLLADSDLAERDRAFATELVYGVTRQRRAVDFLVDHVTRRDLDVSVRRVLRLGVYQLVWLQTPAHAAVSATVDLAPKRAKGFVNAALRSLTRLMPNLPAWPDEATALSYPDWVLRRLTADLGPADARAALERMNDRPQVTLRADGYTQDLASQWVAASVEAESGETVLDVCAGPGGKATAMAAAGAAVIGADRNPTRAALVAGNARRLRASVATVVADGRAMPVRPGSADRVLVDAPCSGLGVLRRRPDARWRIEERDVAALARLQQQLVGAATDLVRPGGRLTYSVCTMTAAETLDVDRRLEAEHPDWRATPPPEGPWRPHGRGALLLPQDADTDGMYVLNLTAPRR